jgi:hypothetical protein
LNNISHNSSFWLAFVPPAFCRRCNRDAQAL